MAGTADARERSDEAALLARLRARDEQAFAALVDGWSGWMLRLAREHVATPNVAEEVVQETWLAVLQGLDRFRGEASLRTWVYRILLNQARRRGARERRSLPFTSLTSEDDGPTVDPGRFQGPDEPFPGGWRQFPEEWPEQAALRREVHDVVADALGRLPARQRIVVALRDLEGHTAAEVCDLLGISLGNQRVLLHRGRAVVRAQLERYLAAVPAGGSEPSR
jgi:RNA polymerase sigma-70 factor (ECF subfamily)